MTAYTLAKKIEQLLSSDAVQVQSVTAADEGYATVHCTDEKNKTYVVKVLDMYTEDAGESLNGDCI